MIANEKEIAAMSIVQERIQENERQLTLDRQNLAHMENSSWRHMDDRHCGVLAAKLRIARRRQTEKRALGESTARPTRQ
jgi:hypothetical protein